MSQCSIGGRYRFAVTDCGAFGLVLTATYLSMLHALAANQAPVSTAKYRILIRIYSSKGVSVASWRALESKAEAEVESTGCGEVAPIDANRTRPADGGVVAVRHRIESRVVGAQEQIRTRDEHAGALEKARRNLVRERYVAEPDPVDVALDEQLFARAAVIRRVDRWHDDDAIRRRIVAVFLAVAQHARDDARRVPVEGERREAVIVEERLRGIEDVAATSEIEQCIERERLVVERIHQAQRPLRRAIVAGVDERTRANGQARVRVDQKLTVLVPQVEIAGEGFGGKSRCGAVAHIAIQPGVRHVRLRQVVRQADGLAVMLVEVGLDVPRELRLLDRRAAENQLETMILRHGAVQVEQDEARGVALTNVLNDLVRRSAAVIRRVDAQAVLEPAELRPELGLLLELRLQIRIWTGEAIHVAAVRRWRELERRPVGVWKRVATSLGVRGAQATRGEPALQ